jgi:hypothetical protein
MADEQRDLIAEARRIIEMLGGPCEDLWARERDDCDVTAIGRECFRAPGHKGRHEDRYGHWGPPQEPTP